MKHSAVDLDGIAMLIFGMCITSFNRWLLGQKDWERVVTDVACMSKFAKSARKRG